MAKFILYKHKIVEQYNKIKEISDIVSYSYKTNPKIGDLMQELLKKEIDKGNLWFSINSKYTMFKRNFDLPVLFFMQGEKEHELKEIIKKTNLFVVDNERDLEKLLKLTKNQDITLFLRVKIREHTVNTGKYFVYGFSKFEIKEILDNLIEKENLTLGIHFHRKTQNVGEWFLKEEFEEIFEDYIDYLNFVNIGGGFPWYYVNSKPNLEVIFKKVKEFKEWLNKKNIKLITEPGRFIAAPCVDLEAEVLTIYNNTAILDCSIYNAYIDTYLIHTRLFVKNEIDEEEVRKLLREGKKIYSYLLKGCTPDSLDIFRYKVLFKEPLKEGQKIILKHCGAYNFHVDFNDLPKLEYEIKD
ncbi:MAG: decarboxylase [Nanoarchaeota archaeon]